MNFKVVRDKSGRFVLWPGGYKLIAYPSGRFLFMDGDANVFKISEILKEKDVLVFGEPGSGFSRFLNWLKKNLNRKPAAIINEESDIKCFPELLTRTPEIEDLLLKFHTENFLSVIEALVKTVKDPIHLVFNRLPPEKAEEIAKNMRSLRDRRDSKYDKIRLIILSRSEDAFIENAVASAYLDFCTVFRMARFNQEEATSIVQEYLETSSIAPKAIDTIMTFTGGQPALVHAFAKEFLEYDDPEIDAELVNFVFDDLKSNGIHLLEQWERSLMDHIKEHPEARDILSKYMREDLEASRLPPPVRDRGLYVAGWLGKTSAGNWGIVSQFHRHVISKVLVRR